MPEEGVLPFCLKANLCRFAVCSSVYIDICRQAWERLMFTQPSIPRGMFVPSHSYTIRMHQVRLRAQNHLQGKDSSMYMCSSQAISVLHTH